MTAFAQYVHLLANLKDDSPRTTNRGAVKTFTPELMAAVVDRYVETGDAFKTSQEFGVSDWSVRRWAAKRSVYRPKSSTRHTPEQWAEAKRLIAEGHSLRRAAAAAGIPYGTIQHWRNR